MQNVTYAQPYEGVAGTLRDQDDLLSLEDKAMPRRAMIMAMAWNLNIATLQYGNKWNERIRNPQVGDLVVETSRGITTLRRNLEYKAFGYLLAHREEWSETDEQYAKAVADGDYGEGDKRWHDDTWYVQYGPQPEDVCRWSNCSFIAAAVSLDFRPT